MDNYSLIGEMDISTLNSQINEQKNRGLKKIAPQLAFMSLNNFMQHLKHYLALKNMEQINKLKK